MMWNVFRFWDKRNNEVLDQKLRPSLSEYEIATLPYIERDPQIFKPKVSQNIFKTFEIPDYKIQVQENDSLSNKINLLKTNEEDTLTLNDDDVDNNELRVSLQLPNVENTMHVMKNKGKYFVQESLHKSHSPMYTLDIQDVIKCKFLIMLYY